MKNILITGASSGIGAAATQVFANKGFHIFAGYRSQSISASKLVSPVKLDVCSAESIAAARAHIESQLGNEQLDALICCAGQFSAGSLENSTMEQWQHTLQVNTVGSAACVQAFLPMLRASKGRIILLSSVGGYLAAPYVSSYIASKFAVEGLADSLRLELYATGVKVALVQPGAINTAMLDETSQAVDKACARETLPVYQKLGDSVADFYRQAPQRALPPAKVVAAIEHALLNPRPKTRYAIGAEAKMLRALQALLPDRFFDAIKRKSLGL
jgi:NAD(P)-dependent dehydrogenase (short-subunit alcohol dehydrogenase family)